MQIGIERDLIEGVGCRRRDLLELEVAVAVGVVDITAERFEVVANVVIGSRPLTCSWTRPADAAQHVARILRDEEGKAEARADVGALHALDAVDVVEPAHEVDANAAVEGQPRVRLPAVLDVDADVAIARGRLLELDRRFVAAMEGAPSRRWDRCRIDLAHLFEA